MTESTPGPQPRSVVSQTEADQHGAFDYGELERLGLRPEEVIDFSVNSNPYGPSPTIREALAAVPLDRYPDREALALRRVLAERLGVAISQIVLGNGTAELLWLVALAFLHPTDNVLIIGPTFGEYRRSAELMGACVHTWTARPDEQFALDARAIGEALERIHPKIVYVCNPNNPTGVALDPACIARWAAAHERALFLVDEAYLSFASDARSAVTLALPNLLVLRSMTKDYALAGLRLGYTVGPPVLIQAIARVRPPWNVNALAQAAGVAALADEGYYRETLAALRAATSALRAGLAECHLSPLPSAVHFFLAEVGEGAAFRRALLSRGIQVRDCASFGLPSYVRIATHRPEENARLLAALRESKPWRA